MKCPTCNATMVCLFTSYQCDNCSGLKKPLYRYYTAVTTYEVSAWTQLRMDTPDVLLPVRLSKEKPVDGEWIITIWSEEPDLDSTIKNATIDKLEGTNYPYWDRAFLRAPTNRVQAPKPVQTAKIIVV